jgi:hypothetical protein
MTRTRFFRNISWGTTVMTMMRNVEIISDRCNIQIVVFSILTPFSRVDIYSPMRLQGHDLNIHTCEHLKIDINVT